MKIVFLSGGAREKALKFLLDKGENICAVITPTPSKNNNRFQGVIDVAKNNDLPVFPITKDDVVKKLKELSPDILVSCGYSYILDEEAIAIPKYAINVHPTLLPKYRGYRSGPFVILNNEKETGVTVHFIDKEIDRGDILVQRSFPLTSFDTQKSIYRKTQEIEPQALYDAIQILKSGVIQTKKQDETQTSEYSQMRTPEDSKIDPSLSLEALYNEIRACDPVDFPAFFDVDGQKVCIKLWRQDKPDNESDMI